MGDRKPPKKSSGSSDAHKAKKDKDQANRPPAPQDQSKGKPKK